MKTNLVLISGIIILTVALCVATTALILKKNPVVTTPESKKILAIQGPGGVTDIWSVKYENFNCLVSVTTMSEPRYPSLVHIDCEK